MSKVLVTGFAGFIGSHLTESLVKRKDKVCGLDNFSRGEFNKRVLHSLSCTLTEIIDGDILNLELIKKTIINNNFDVIYHLAALPSHRLALERPHDYLMIDLAGTANILEAARLSKKKPLIVFASSNKVYGKQSCPWREDKLPQPEGPYAVSKWSAEKLCEMYNKYYDLPCVILRYHHVAGARSNPELALSIFTEQALKGEDLEVHGDINDGTAFVSCSADYTHVDDAVRATILAVEKYKGFDIYNIANKKKTYVLDMAEYVVKKLNSKSKINFVPMLPHETLEHLSDVSKAEKELGFTARIPIEKAFDDYVSWRVKYEK